MSSEQEGAALEQEGAAPEQRKEGVIRVELEHGPEIPTQHTKRALYVAEKWDTLSKPHPDLDKLELVFKINQLQCVFDGESVSVDPSIAQETNDEDGQFTMEQIDIYNEVIRKFKEFKASI